jgi:diguanylate cyclase (GGDEF)-like protein
VAQDAQDQPSIGGRRARSVGVLLVAIVVVTLVSLLTTLAYAFSWSSERARSDARGDARFQARLAAEAVEDSIEESVQSLATVPGNPGLIKALEDPTGCALTSSGLGVFPDAHLDLVRADGTVVCSSLSETGAPAGASHAGAAWLDEALGSEGPVTSRTVTDATTGRSSIVIATRLVKGTEPIGVVAYVLRSDGVAAALGKTYGGPQHFQYTVSEPAKGVIRSTSATGAGTERRLGHTGFAATRGTWNGLDGREKLYESAAVPRLGWRVHAGVPVGTVTGTARAMLLRLAGVAAVSLLALAAMAWFVHRRIVRPLRSITAEIVAAREHQLPSPVHVQGPAEVSLLADEFNSMLEARLGYEALLSEQALHDDLTGLPNRALVRDRLEQSLRRMDSESGQAAVLFVDLDRFKVINDSLGHPAGDALLRQVAHRIADTLRTSDTIGRFGGDEFIVVCEEVADTVDAVDVARRIEFALDEPFPVGGTEVTVTASIGIAIAGEDDRNPDEMIRRADIAMYHAKERHRGWELFDDDLRDRANGRLEVEQELRGAIGRGEIHVHYQPIWDLATDRLSGIEALARWNHPERGPIPPGTFIPVAEETGLIASIGDLVLRQACTHAAQLNRDGHDLEVAVNVSVLQLTEDFPNVVKDAVQRAGLDPTKLVLEITESSLVQVLGPGADTLARLRALGCSIAIDDFGTGYSSLSYLQHFTIDVLKVDRSFVDQLGRDRRTNALVNAIVTMARSLDLTVVAEGVETIEQLVDLRRLDCTHAQGYLLARPMPFDEVRRLVAARRARPVPLGRDL